MSRVHNIHDLAAENVTVRELGPIHFLVQLTERKCGFCESNSPATVTLAAWQTRAEAEKHRDAIVAAIVAG